MEAITAGLPALRKMICFTVLVAALGSAAEAEDGRIALELPPDVKVHFLEHMRAHMTSLNDVVQLMAAGKIREAGTVASTEMAVGKGMGIGRYMPPEFRQMGMELHISAADFARTTASLAEPLDAAGWSMAASGLAQVTARCTACHATFRLR